MVPGTYVVVNPSSSSAVLLVMIRVMREMKEMRAMSHPRLGNLVFSTGWPKEVNFLDRARAGRRGTAMLREGEELGVPVLLTSVISFISTSRNCYFTINEYLITESASD